MSSPIRGVGIAEFRFGDFSYSRIVNLQISLFVLKFFFVGGQCQIAFQIEIKKKSSQDFKILLLVIFFSCNSPNYEDISTDGGKNEHNIEQKSLGVLRKTDFSN